MRMLIAVIAAWVLGGCATTPQQVREQGAVHFRTLKNPPEPAALCATRNMENASGFFVVLKPTVRPGLKPGTMEIVEKINLVADIEPEGSGSKARIALNAMIPAMADLFLEQFEGC